MDHKKTADSLYQAMKNSSTIKPLTRTYPGITLDDAYEIQMENVKTVLSSNVKMTGKKIGLTSKAMQNMLGVEEPDFGHLFEDMEVRGGMISFSEMIQPKVEAEIAFVMGKDITGDELTADDILDATEYVIASLEIVDSRIENWMVKLQDTVADNASSGRYVLGTKKKAPRDMDLKGETMELYKNGEKINSGRGVDVFGDPMNSVLWLAEKMLSLGSEIKKGEILLSGAMSAALSAKPGDMFRAEFKTLGSAEVSFKV